MPSTSDVVPFSSSLICSQFLSTVSELIPRSGTEPVGHDVTEDVRMAAHELVVDAAGDIGHGEAAGLFRQHRVEHDFVQQVAELVFERGVRAGGNGNVAARRLEGQRFDRFHHFVRLFEEVARQRVMGLLRIPRAPTRVTEPLGELQEPHDLAGRARGPRLDLDVERGEVIGLDGAVELGQLDGRDQLVGEAEALQHRDRRGRVEMLEQRELHVGQHERVVALRDQHRAGELRVVDGAPVDHARRAPSGRPRAAPTRDR